MLEQEPTEEQKDKSYVVKGSLINSLGIVVNVISPLLIIVLARFFSQTEFGLFISLQLFVLTASRFFVLGLDKGLQYYIPQNQLKKRPVHTGLFESLTIATTFSLIGVLISVIAISFGILSYFPKLATLPMPVFLIAATNLVPYMTLHIGAAAFDGIRKPHIKIVINKFLVDTGFPIIAIVCSYLGCGIYSLIIGYTIANWLGVIYYIYIIRKDFFSLKLSFKLPSELRNYSIPLIVSDIISSILLRVDIWMILLFLGPKRSAVYSIMVTLSNGVKTIRQMFDSLILTVISKMDRHRISTELTAIFSYTINIVTSIQILIAVAILFFPAEIMSIAGKRYSIEVQALSVLLLGNLINGILGANGLIILGLGKSKLALYINSATLALNIILNVILIPLYDISGAAIATVISLLVQNVAGFIATIILTKRAFYEKHLIINMVLIALFGWVTFNLFEPIQSLSFFDRALYFALSVMLLGSIYFIKRATFKHR